MLYEKNQYVMIIACNVYLLLIIICQRYVSICYIWSYLVVAKSSLLWNAAVPHLCRASAVYRPRQCRILNFTWKLGRNDNYSGPHLSSLYPIWATITLSLSSHSPRCTVLSLSHVPVSPAPSPRPVPCSDGAALAAIPPMLRRPPPLLQGGAVPSLPSSIND